MDISYLTQDEAIAVDEELMGPLGFSVDQLMELAGLSAASAVASEYGRESHPKCLVLAGPGNNGGDGLCMSRHLHHFGYDVAICYPKRTSKPLYEGLVQQCSSLNIPFVSVEELPTPLSDAYDVVVDALFGFSFRGSPRPPFDGLLEMLRPSANPPKLVSIDIPSGWHVELGDEGGLGIRPDMLVSLTAPKLCARQFKGEHHYLGGRFVPPAIKVKYNLRLPDYPGTSQCIRITQESRRTPDAMRDSYDKFTLLEADVLQEPMEQFERWFQEASQCSDIREPNAMSLATANQDGAPSVRMVLLKGYAPHGGFTFYTNFDSRKGRELSENSRAAITFWWEPLQRSVRAEGAVARVPEDEAERYFHSRPRGSQLGAWASPQSSVIPGREVLAQKEAEVAEQYDQDPSAVIPKPPHWGGFQLIPDRVEFWQGRPNRLHDRIQYNRAGEGGSWTMSRLAP